MPDKKDVYTRITNKIADDLAHGIRPWMQSWNAEHAAGKIARPLRYNGIPYKGINVVILWSAAMEKGYACPLWLTLKQSNALGGYVRGGEKSACIVYANRLTKKEIDDNGDEIERSIRFMKGYSVFNAEQCENLPAQYYALAAPPRLTPAERFAHLDDFFTNTHAAIRHGGDRAYYREADNHIHMPPFETFITAESYYATLAHELTHWTRHPTRLQRDFGRKKFGDEGYAKEELVAELGSAFLAADLQIEPEVREDHGDYIGSWLQALKNDKRLIFVAAAYAQRAVEYLHSLQPQIACPPALEAEPHASQQALPPSCPASPAETPYMPPSQLGLF